MNSARYKSLFLLLLLAFGSLEATLQDPGVESATDGDPSNTLSECVSLSTGDFVVSSEDLRIEGAFPLTIHRHYVSGNGSSKRGGWEFFPHVKLKALRYKNAPSTKFKRLLLKEPTGTSFIYKKQDKHTIEQGWVKFAVDFEKNGKGITNTARGPISARTNLKNFELFQIMEKKFRLYCPDGTERLYSQAEGDSKKGKMPIFLLRSELHPDGHKTLYKYDSKNRINYVQNTNFDRTKVYAWCHITYNVQDLDIHTSDGRKLSYAFNSRKSYKYRRYFLESVKSPQHPPETLEYGYTEYGRRLKSRHFPEGRKIKAQFCGGRVATLYQRVGPSKEMKATHRLNYYQREGESRSTEVLDAYNNKTVYTYSDRFLPKKIAYHQGEALHHSVESKWNGDGELTQKIIADNSGAPLLVGSYTYDSRGNILEETLSGNLTALNSQDSRTTIQVYDERDLLIKKIEPSGLITTLAYLEKTPLITEKILTDGSEIFIRESYRYSKDRVLIEKTTDDGYLTKIQRIQLNERDLPYIISELALNRDTGEEILINKVELTYNDQAKVTQKVIYGSDGKLYQTLKTEYDRRGRVIKEFKPQEQISCYEYDLNNDCTFEKTPHGKEITRTYDAARRLQQEKELSPEGEERQSAFEYDFKCNKTASIDPFGNRTQYAYDAFGKIIQIILPDGSTEQFTYDALGNQASHTDARGYATTTLYSALGKPLLVTYPDGSEESYTYHSDGTLASYTNQEQATVYYHYDALGRKIAITYLDAAGSQIAEETFTYQGMLLQSEKDKESIITSYEYDSAGRKTAVERAGTRTEYSYDPLGRIAQEKGLNGKNSLLIKYSYDLLSQLIEEIHQDLNGHILRATTYTYDKQGNRTSSTCAGVTERTLYDGYNRLVLRENALGEQTRISYNENHLSPTGQKTLCKTTIDPMGFETVEVYDPLMRLVQKTLLNRYGQTIFREEYSLDANGNCHTQLSHTYHGADYLRTLVISKEYDALNRTLSIREGAYTPEEKTTHFTYTPTGKLATTQKPDGTLLTYSYDTLGNHIELLSSDGTIHYTYSYTLGGHLTRSHDEIHNRTTTRELDANGNILTEALANGLILQKRYDLQNRKTHLYLPDTTPIKYTYDPLHLRQVTALGRTTNYSYDRRGNLLSRGATTFRFDKLDRPTALITPYFTQIMEYDARGNLVEMEKEDHIQTLTYDDLSQLISEQGHTYDYDSHYNRLAKDQTPYAVNTIHSVVAAGTTTYTYDQNGNPTAKTTPSQTTQYEYDALDRLVTLRQGKMVTTYTYDSFHRRLTKSVFKKGLLACHHNYLYDDLKELGATNSQGSLIELRILGLNERDALLLILNNKTYLPIQDLQGNIVCLIAEDRSETQAFHYSAFGEESPSPSHNPWRYFSKRFDTESGLIYFGQRYYDPDTGRFLTPDPSDLTDSFNLYAFAYNNPLIHYDAYGLFSQPLLGARDTPPPIEFGQSHPSADQMRYLPFESLANDLYRLSSGADGMPSLFPAPSPYFERSSLYDLGRPEIPDRGILYVNGVFNDLESSTQSALYLSKLAGDTNVRAVHCATFGKQDIVHAQLLLNYTNTEPVRLLHQACDNYFRGAGPDATLLIIAHSNGNSVARNCLITYPEDYRQRIYVLSMSPAGWVDPSLCGNVVGYRSNDPITHLDREGSKRYAHTMTTLKPHPDESKYFDHSIRSKTFQKRLNAEINDYLRTGAL